MTLKPATLLNYGEQSFTDWADKVGAEYGTIAIDTEKNELLKQYDTPVDLQDAESDLNKLGYTLGLGGQNG